MNGAIEQLKTLTREEAQAQASLRSIEERIEELENRQNPAIELDMSNRRRDALAKFALGEITDVKLSKVKQACSQAMEEQADIVEMLSALSVARTKLNNLLGGYQPKIKELRRQVVEDQYAGLLIQAKKLKGFEVLRELRAWSMMVGLDDGTLVDDLFGALSAEEVDTLIFKRRTAEGLDWLA